MKILKACSLFDKQRSIEVVYSGIIWRSIMPVKVAESAVELTVEWFSELLSDDNQDAQFAASDYHVKDYRPEF